MHAGGVQRIFPILNAQEAGTLFKSLRTQLGHLEKLFPVGEPAVGFSVFYNIFCDGLRDS